MPMTEMPFSQGHFLSCRKAQRCTIPSINKFTPHCSTASVNSIHLQQDKAKQDKTKDKARVHSIEVPPNLDIAFANTFAAAVDAATDASTASAVAMNLSNSNEDVNAIAISMSYNAIAASSA